MAKKGRIERIKYLTQKVQSNNLGRSKKERGIYLEDIIKKLAQEEKQLLVLQQNIEKQLQNLPDGRLKIRIRNGKPEYHIVTLDGIEKYIRKEQKALASALAQKAYLNKSLSNISIQLSTIRQFLNHYSLEAISASYQDIKLNRENWCDYSTDCIIRINLVCSPWRQKVCASLYTCNIPAFLYGCFYSSD